MRVALVGAEFEENLAVRYLWGALEAAGHRVAQVVFNDADETEAAARVLAESGAELAGFSMVFTHRARQFANLALRARELGYRGHIIAGGHFAAFHAEEILRDVSAFDSVGCGEGEELLCKLAGGLHDLGSIRGLVWRDGAAIRKNEPALKPPDLDVLPHPVRKRPLDDYLGIPITNILASRGCRYGCSFCSIAAWHRLCGGERFRLRDPEKVASEVAEVYAQGARIFNFHDDNFFVPDKAQMLERLGALKRALERHGVGRIAFAVKARPDVVDEELFSELREMGLFRVFLGIEAGTRQALRQLGRRQTLEQNEHALEVVNRLDIHTAFNLLLLNPDSTLEDVRENVDFLRAHPKNPMNFCRTEIYAGTPLERKLRRESRLLGDYWGYSYRIADPRAQAFFELVRPAFHSRNYGHDGLHHLAMQVDYEHQLLSHFAGGSESLRRRVKRFIVEVNLDTCDKLEGAIAICERSRATKLGELQARVEAANRRLSARANALIDEIRELAQPTSSDSAAWLRTARVVGLAASMSLAATGCKKCGMDTHPTEMVAPPTETHPNETVPEPPPEPPDAAADASADAGTAQAPSADAGSKKPPAADAGAKQPPKRPTHPTEMIPDFDDRK